MTASYGPRPSPERLAEIAAQPKWEEVANSTYRLPVPGGWLYRHGHMRADAMVFVPSGGVDNTQ